MSRAEERVDEVFQALCRCQRLVAGWRLERRVRPQEINEIKEHLRVVDLELTQLLEK